MCRLPTCLRFLHCSKVSKCQKKPHIDLLRPMKMQRRNHRHSIPRYGSSSAHTYRNEDRQARVRLWLQHRLGLYLCQRLSLSTPRRPFFAKRTKNASYQCPLSKTGQLPTSLRPTITPNLNSLWKIYFQIMIVLHVSGYFLTPQTHLTLPPLLPHQSQL